MTIVGIDCATVNEKTGLAFATYARGTMTIEECFIAEPKIHVAAQIKTRLSKTPCVLLALDAPLGWPAPLGTHLSKHFAGKAITLSSNSLFRRRTDEVIRDRLHKAPLEVGANFIARTAVSALRLVADLSELTATEIPLAWQPFQQKGISAIEVYPAGTLRAYQEIGFIRGVGTVVQRKKALLRHLERKGRLHFPSGLTRAVRNEHVLDSVVCCIAALDFLEGHAISPTMKEDEDKATKEGWIWVRNPDIGT